MITGGPEHSSFFRGFLFVLNLKCGALATTLEHAVNENVHRQAKKKTEIFHQDS